MFTNASYFHLQNNPHCSNFTRNAETHSFAEYYLWSAIVVGILSPVAVAGNGLVLVAIWRNRSLRTPSYILLAGLAFTDFSTGLISQPFYIAHNLILSVNQTSAVHRHYEITTAIMDGCATYFFFLTVLIITLMSIERWLHMSRRTLITVRRACFTIAALLPLPIPLVVYRISVGTHRNELGFASLSVVLFCLTLTSAAYLKVFRIIRHHQQQVRASEFSQNNAQPVINLSKYRKSVFSILYILAVFYTGYLPITITIGVMIALKSEYELLILNISVVLVFLSSSLNPLLYFWRMKDIRNEVERLVKRMLCTNN